MKALFNQLSSYALPTPIDIDGWMVNVSSPAVMADKYRPDNLTICIGNEAHFRVSLKICMDTLFRISRAQTDSLAASS